MAERKALNKPESEERRVSRRGFTKVVLVLVGAAVAGVAGLTQLKRLRQQPPVTTIAHTSVTTSPESQVGAELVLLNGKIITVDSNDSVVEALAANAGKFIKVGTNDEVSNFIGQSTMVIDLKGKTATPGLIDSHCHIGGGYPEKYHLDLRPGKADSIADIVRLVAKKVEETPKGDWVLGFGWFPAYWSERRLPNRLDLDPVSPEHPVFLTDMSGWYGWVNSHQIFVDVAPLYGSTNILWPLS